MALTSVGDVRYAEPDARSWTDRVLDRNLLPDWLLRAIIRRIVAGRLREQARGGPAMRDARFAELVSALERAPVAADPAAANLQHYEWPAAFFAQVLGPHLKYSSGWWPGGVTSLGEAETRMLDLTVARADLADGQRVLDLGCGWGSLTLYIAHRFPGSRIVGVSNSARQRRYILEQVRARGLSNVEVITADVNDLDLDGSFDRIVSVEMLEHVRNYRALFARMARWLTPDGRLFIHIFAHRQFAYAFESRGVADWMARYFFTGGMMPSDHLFARVQDDFIAERHWRLSGRHYQRTAEAWLQNFDRDPERMSAILAGAHGAAYVERWRARWRIFFMACAEMFGHRGGREWIVSHYRLRRRM